MALNFNKYPRNWPKVSRIIRRIADGLCERCGQPAHSVHHIGAPLALATAGGQARNQINTICGARTSFHYVLNVMMSWIMAR